MGFLVYDSFNIFNANINASILVHIPSTEWQVMNLIYFIFMKNAMLNIEKGFRLWAILYIDELLPQAKFNNIPFNPIVRILVFFPFFFDHIDYPCLGEILVTKTKSNLHCSIYQGSSMLIGQV